MPPKRVLQIKPHTRTPARGRARGPGGRGAEVPVVTPQQLEESEVFGDLDEAAILMAPEIPALVEDALTVVCVVNGKQNLSLIMELSDDTQVIEAPAMPDLQHKPLFNGRIEIEVVWTTPTQRQRSHRQGLLIVDNEHVLDLGPLQTKPVQCAMLVDRAPTSLRLEVRRVPHPPTHPSERLLIRAVDALLDNEEFLGSLSTSHVQNLLRDLPFFPDVVGSLHKDFAEFASAHPDRWHTFKYTREEIEKHDLGVTVRDTETRIVSQRRRGSCLEGDINRDRIRRKCEAELHESLRAKLTVRPYNQRELQAALLRESCYTTLLAPNYAKILESFAAQEDRYFVMFDRLHDVFVEVRRHDYTDPFVDGVTAAGTT